MTHVITTSVAGQGANSELEFDFSRLIDPQKFNFGCFWDASPPIL